MEVAEVGPRTTRVAVALDLPYLRLMELAGYLDEADLATLEDRTPKPHPLAGRSLSDEEWRQVGVFINEPIARRS